MGFKPTRLAILPQATLLAAWFQPRLPRAPWATSAVGRAAHREGPHCSVLVPCSVVLPGEPDGRLPKFREVGRCSSSFTQGQMNYLGPSAPLSDYVTQDT